MLALAAVQAAAPPVLLESLVGRQVFPATNWWNQDISGAPVDARSPQLIDWISGRIAVQPDGGAPAPSRLRSAAVRHSVRGGRRRSGAGAGRPSDTPARATPAYPACPAIRFRTRRARPPNYIEGGHAGRRPVGRSPSAGHRPRSLAALRDVRDHVECDRGAMGGGSGAIFDLATNARRPERWTSADAAGLAIFPGLVRYDEVSAPAEITHAFRVTTRDTNGYVWPASHDAGSTRQRPADGRAPAAEGRRRTSRRSRRRSSASSAR